MDTSPVGFLIALREVLYQGISISKIYRPTHSVNHPGTSRLSSVNDRTGKIVDTTVNPPSTITQSGSEDLPRVRVRVVLLDSPLHCGRPVISADGEAMKATIILIEFVSSSLWQSHLRRSNFTSCEEIMSMEEGTKNALTCMLRVATRRWTELLLTPEKIVAAIRRLEELQCLNTAQVVIMWAWTIGVVNPVDRVDWKLIQDETLRFYNAHGVQRLVALALHVIDTTTELAHEFFLRAHYKNSPYRVGCVRRPDPTLRGAVFWGESGRSLCLSGLSAEEVVSPSWL